MHTYTRTYTHFYAPPHPNTMVCDSRASFAREESASCGSNRGPLPASSVFLIVRLLSLSLINLPPSPFFSSLRKLQFLSCTLQDGNGGP
uniref:Uncharacterized protein n=1 Tax=Ixodes ricinus TaxID=34613 RepID=A0A090XD43_IXORI